jgi:uncharacterized protein YceH (UPF0502 family)
MNLSVVEIRVLGALIEKDMATPEYYPLSLNALVNACNQKSNRNPVVAYSEDDVRAGLEVLRDRGWVSYVSETGSRVEKYRHRLGEAFNLTRGELALLAALLLRGPQTLAELRERCARLHEFDSGDAAAHAMAKLAEREPEPLARLLARQPGTKEPRWMHLLGGEPAEDAAAAPAPAASSLADRVEALEAEVRELRAELAAFRRQFE